MGRYREALTSAIIGAVTVVLTVLLDLVTLRFTVGPEVNFTDPGVLAFDNDVYSRQYDVVLIAFSLLLTARFPPLRIADC